MRFYTIILIFITCNLFSQHENFKKENSYIISDIEFSENDDDVQYKFVNHVIYFNDYYEVWCVEINGHTYQVSLDHNDKICPCKN